MPISFKGIRYHSSIQYQPTNESNNVPASLFNTLNRHAQDIRDECIFNKTNNPHVFTEGREIAGLNYINFYIADEEDGKYLNAVKELMTSKIPHINPDYKEPNFEAGVEWLAKEFNDLYKYAKSLILTKLR